MNLDVMFTFLICEISISFQRADNFLSEKTINQHNNLGLLLFFFDHTQSSTPGEFLGFKCQECSQTGNLKGLMYSLVTLMQLGQL